MGLIRKFTQSFARSPQPQPPKDQKKSCTSVSSVIKQKKSETCCIPGSEVKAFYDDKYHEYIAIIRKVVDDNIYIEAFSPDNPMFWHPKYKTYQKNDILNRHLLAVFSTDTTHSDSSALKVLFNNDFYYAHIAEKPYNIILVRTDFKNSCLNDLSELETIGTTSNLKPMNSISVSRSYGEVEHNYKSIAEAVLKNELRKK